MKRDELKSMYDQFMEEYDETRIHDDFPIVVGAIIEDKVTGECDLPLMVMVNKEVYDIDVFNLICDVIKHLSEFVVKIMEKEDHIDEEYMKLLEEYMEGGPDVK